MTQRSVPDPEQQALAGAIVSIGRDGKVCIERDLLKPEDASRFAQAEKARRARRRHKRDLGFTRRHSCGGSRPNARSPCRRRSLERPDVALVALTHRLVLRAFPMYGCGCESAVGNRASECAGWAAHRGARGQSRPQAALRLGTRRIEAQLPREPEQLFAWLLEQPQAEILSILAFCVALSVDCVQSDEAPSVADELALAAGLDMRTWWTATAESYFAHVSKARILEVVREAISPEVAAALGDLKKGALAAAAETPARRKRLAAAGSAEHRGVIASDVTRPGTDPRLVSGHFFGRRRRGRGSKRGRAGLP